MTFSNNFFTYNDGRGNIILLFRIKKCQKQIILLVLCLRLLLFQDFKVSEKFMLNKLIIVNSK